MRIMIRLSLLLTFLLPGLPAHAAQWSLTYPRALEDGDLRNEYPVALLTLALEKTGVNYSLLPSDRILLQAKALRQLRESREVNVVWSMTDTQREKDLLPIRIPIAKGLIGLRVFLINQQQQQSFAGIASKSALFALSPVQGEDWPDTKILQANGFNVITVPDYKQAHEAISTARADFFPRSVIEVISELKSDKVGSEIVLEPDLALYYPAAMYFFVNKGDATLARLIETGLRQAIEDGSFDALFQSTYEETFHQLALDTRKVYRLDNPLLPELTPLDDERLWYMPASLKKAE